MNAGDAPVFDRIQQLFERLPRGERKIAHALLADYPIAGLETLAKLAARADTSQPTVLRLVNRLGFARYSAFQQALRNELQTQLQSPLARYDSYPRATARKDVFRRVGEALVENLRAAVAQLPRRQYGAVTALLADEQHAVHVLGGRFTHALATYFFLYLRELRPRARLIDPASAAWPTCLLDVGAGDVVVLFDFRRYQPDVVAFGRQAAQQGATVVLFTDAWRSPAAAFARHVIVCPVEVPTAFDSGVGGLAMIELFVAGIVERLGRAGKTRIGTLEALRRQFETDTAAAIDPPASAAR